MKLEHFIELKIHNRFIGYRRVGFLFDMYAWFLLYKRHGVNLKHVCKDNAEAFMELMIHAAALSYCKETGRKVWFKEGDVKEWLEGMTNRDAKALAKVFAESMEVVADLAQVTEEEGGVKKKK